MWILVVVLLANGAVQQGKMIGMDSEEDCKTTLSTYQERFKGTEAQVWGECINVPVFKKGRDS